MGKIRITTIDYIILGLLQAQDLSGYAIRIIFETTAIGSYSGSPGTVYPAINKIKKLGFIESIQSTDGKKSKLRYTAKGKSELINWLKQDISDDDISKRMEILILRFGFMGDIISHPEKLKFLKSFIDKTSIYLVQLQTYHKQESSSMHIQGRLAFEYGLETIATSLDWAKKAIIALKKNN
ncbi:MAG: PadR family transcriptional regulator [Bacteroidales bacterium]|nr:PadR family transcriptional regulator [Bacteroidales bacterium]